MNIFTKAAMIAVGLIAFMTACSNYAAANQFTDVSNSVYKLYQGDRGVCSAVAVSPTRLVTAAHCVNQGEKDLNIRLKDVRANDLTVVKETKVTFDFTSVNPYYRNHDVAILDMKAPVASLTPAPVCPGENLQIGDPLIVIGFPLALEKQLSFGVFTGLSSLEKELGIEGLLYKTTAPIAGGNSGGGLFELQNGQYCLLGLTSASFNPAVISTMSYFTRNDVLQKMLLEFPAKGYEVQPLNQTQ